MVFTESAIDAMLPKNAFACVVMRDPGIGRFAGFDAPVEPLGSGLRSCEEWWYVPYSSRFPPVGAPQTLEY